MGGNDGDLKTGSGLKTLPANVFKHTGLQMAPEKIRPYQQGANDPRVGGV